jgi:hypothetical protein
MPTLKIYRPFERREAFSAAENGQKQWNGGLSQQKKTNWPQDHKDGRRQARLALCLGYQKAASLVTMMNNVGKEINISFLANFVKEYHRKIENLDKKKSILKYMEKNKNKSDIIFCYL